MSFRSTFLFLCLFPSFLVHGQDNGNDDLEHKLGVKSGYMNFRMRDRSISSLLYKGSAVPIQLDYSHLGQKAQNNIYIMFGAGVSNLQASSLDGFKYRGDLGNFVDDTIGSLDHKTIRTSFYGIGYEVLGKLKSSGNGKLKAFLGGGLSLFELNQKFLSMYYTNSIKSSYTSLHVAGRLTYNVHAKHRFAYALSVPLISRINRQLTLEAGDPEEFKQWATFNQYFAFNNSLSYTFRFAHRWSLEAVYQFNYFQCSFPRKEQVAMESLTAGINFHF